MSRLKRITAGLTALALSFSLTACGANTRTALTIDGYQVPAGVYIYYLNTAYSNAVSQLSEDNPDLDTTDKNAIKGQLLDGKDITTWIQDKATEMVTDFVATENKFEELGLSLDADAKSNISMMKDYYWAGSQETFEKNGISEDSFTKILTSSYKSDEVFKYYYGIDGQEGVTEDDLKQYYIDNNIRCQYINISLKDSEGNLLKSDGKAEMMELLEGYRDRVQKAYDEGGEESAREEMNAVTDDYNAYQEAQSEEEEDFDIESETTTEDETSDTSAEDTTNEDEIAEDTTEEETSAENEDSDEDSEETTAETEEGETAEVQDEPLSAPIVEQILTAENDADADDSSADEETPEETTEEAETTQEDENDTPEEEETTAEDEEITDEITEEDETEFVPDYDVEFEDSLPEEEEAEESAEDEEELAVTSVEDGAEDDTLDIGGDTAPSYTNETIIRVINPDDYDDPDDIYYTPSEKVYNQLLEIKEADYGKPYIVEEDENYYLVVRYDITERMTETDLWTDSAIDNADYQAHNKEFEDLMDSWTATASVAKNEAAYKRYDPFKLEF